MGAVAIGMAFEAASAPKFWLTAPKIKTDDKVFICQLFTNKYLWFKWFNFCNVKYVRAPQFIFQLVPSF